MSYNLERITKEFQEVCNKANVSCNIPIKLNGRLTKTLGRVKCCGNPVTGVYESTLVEFSKQMLDTTTDESIKNVILHEAAHHIATSRTGKTHGHDSYFKAVCAEIGAKYDETTIEVERTVDFNSIYKYTVRCNTCNEIIGGYNRMNNTLRDLAFCSCKKCGTYNLSYSQNW